MRRTNAVLCGAAALFLFYLTGCEKSTNMATQPPAVTPVAPQDQTAIGNAIAADPLFTTDAAALSDGPPSLGKTDTAIVPRAWGRMVQSATRSVSYNQLNDSTVIATVTNTLTGQVWIRVRRSMMSDTIFYKPLSETIMHNVEFAKVPIPGFTQLTNWKMVAVSGTEGGTDNHGITIQNVTFFMGTDTVQLMNPLDSLFQFVKGHRHFGCRDLVPDNDAPFKVMVTVMSTDPDSDIVTTHRPFQFAGRFMRTPMTLVSSAANGDGTFTRVYTSAWRGDFVGRFNLFVSAITRQSIFDDQAPFASQIWGLPFVVDPD